GGLATYVGTPANIMIGSAAKLNFYDFIYHTTPISIILILFNVFYFVILFKNTFKKNNTQNDIILQLNKIDERKAITNLPLFKNSLLILVITIISSFFSHLIKLLPFIDAINIDLKSFLHIHISTFFGQYLVLYIR
ncbi:unnamed protein product, partial [marine sediment metagenome]